MNPLEPKPAPLPLATQSTVGSATTGAPLALKRQPDANLAGSVVPLLLLLSCTWLALWLFKRFKLGKSGKTAPERNLSVLQTVHLSPKVHVAHVACGGQEFLLAYSDTAQAWTPLAANASNKGAA